MKIAYVITRSDRIGGAQIHACDLASAMQNRGHDVNVLVGGDGLFLEMLEKARVPFTPIANLVRPVHPYKDLLCANELTRAIDKVSPQVVHCHSSKAGILGRLAAKRLGIPSVFSAHGWSFTEGIKKHRAMVFKTAEKVAANWCNRILCGCERDRQFGLERGVGSEEKIETIWYGMHNLEDRPLADPSINPPRMTMVARFEEQKDHDTLVRALGQVKDLQWEIDLLGDGPLRSGIEKLTDSLGIADQVNFVGARPTREYLLRSQIFLLISNWEGLPLSTLEAMRVGLPLIGSDVGGIPEQITEGESGFIIPRGDSDLLAQRLRQMISDPEMRMRMGQAGKERFEADFQYERMLTKVERVYESVIIESGHELTPRRSGQSVVPKRSLDSVGQRRKAKVGN